MMYRVTSEALPCFRWIGDNVDEAERIAFKVAVQTGRAAHVEEVAVNE